MHRGFLKTSFVLAALAVGLGAFAAHGLKNYVSSSMLSTFETAVKYQFYHVFALVITAMLYKQFASASTVLAGRLFIAGIVLFCGSLYLLVFLQGAMQMNYKWLGAITPFGGLCFIVGWLALLWAVGKSRSSPGLPE